MNFYPWVPNILELFEWKRPFHKLWLSASHHLCAPIDYIKRFIQVETNRLQARVPAYILKQKQMHYLIDYIKKLKHQIKHLTCQRSDLLSSSCLGTSRPRIVTKSKNMALFSQQMTRKCLPLVDGGGELKGKANWFTAAGASAAAERLRHSCQKRTSSS